MSRLTRRAKKNASLAVVLIVLALVVVSRRGLTGDIHTSSLKCLPHGSCLLENVFLDMNGTFHYYISEMDDMKRVENSLSQVRLVAAAQLPREVYNTSLAVAIHSRRLIEHQHLTAKHIHEPVFYHNIVAVGNFGHTLLQNCLPAVVSMRRSPLKHEGVFRTIVGNDCKNCGLPDPPTQTCMDGIGSFGYASCETLGNAVYASVTGYSMTFSRELFPANTPLVYFAQVVVGFPNSDAFDLLHNPNGYDFVQEKRIIRKRALEHIHCDNEERSHQISILVYCKDVSVNGRHGNTFQNCSEFLTMLGYSRRRMTQNISIYPLNFDTMNFSDQLIALQSADVFISDGGSSSYYTHFLRHGSTSMTFPLCDEFCVCTHFFTERGAYLNPDVKHIPVDPLHVSCQVNVSAEGKSAVKPLFRVKMSFLHEFIQTVSHVDRLKNAIKNV